MLLANQCLPNGNSNFGANNVSFEINFREKKSKYSILTLLKKRAQEFRLVLHVSSLMSPCVFGTISVKVVAFQKNDGFEHVHPTVNHFNL